MYPSKAVHIQKATLLVAKNSGLHTFLGSVKRKIKKFSARDPSSSKELRSQIGRANGKWMDILLQAEETLLKRNKKPDKVLVVGILFVAVLLLTSSCYLLLMGSVPKRIGEVEIIRTYTEAYEPGSGYVCVTVKNVGKEACSFIVKIYDREWEGWRESDPQNIQPGEEKTVKFGGDFIFIDISSAKVEAFSTEHDLFVPSLSPLSVFLMIASVAALVITAKIDRDAAGKYILLIGIMFWFPGMLITYLITSIWRVGGWIDIHFSGMERAEAGVPVPNLILIPMLVGLVFLLAGSLLRTAKKLEV